MTDLPGTISSDLASYYEFVAAQTHQWVDPLTQEQFWHNPYTYGNSVGHLILHLTGNLSYYIGARVAETGYIRNRDREFTEAAKPEKKKVLEAFDRTIAMVVAAIRKQEPADWLKAYSAEREPHGRGPIHDFSAMRGPRLSPRWANHFLEQRADKTSGAVIRICAGDFRREIAEARHPRATFRA